MTRKRNIIAFLVIGIFGTLSHFIYEWSGKVYTVGLFFPVNESTWEHLKLLFFPALIYFLIEYFTLEQKPKNYLSASVFSVITGMLSIIIMFYTYKGVIGKNIDFLNILIYFLGVIVTLFTRNKLLGSKAFASPFFKIISTTLVIILITLFAGFSYNPPSLGIFLPPEV